MIQISDLSFSYDSFDLLKNVSLEIKAGEFIGIIGPNGGGKTTLLKLCMGFLEPKAGTISLRGKSPKEARLEMGYVPQIHKIDRDFPISVLEFILLGDLQNERTYSLSAKEKALYLMEELELTDYANKPFASLSGGFAQRTLFARASLSDPKILFLDESLANIDPHSTEKILIFLEAHKHRQTVLLVTHDLKTIIERVDRILCVQGTVTSYLPKELCKHFGFGLYHTPFLGKE